MPKRCFSSFIEQSIDRFVSDSKRIDVEKFRQNISESVNKILPDGINTKGHFFYHFLNQKGELVAEAWLGPNEELDKGTIWGWDLFVLPQYQNKLFGYRVLSLIPDILKDTGYTELRFTVYRLNHRARRLYGKLGYRVTAEYEEQIEMSYSLT